MKLWEKSSLPTKGSSVRGAGKMGLLKTPFTAVLTERKPEGSAWPMASPK